MELGNFIFGNSRGEYPVPRVDWMFNGLQRLIDVYTPKRDNGWREYGEEFENDTFVVRSYYWGECTCGFNNFEFVGEHTEKCYQTEYRRIDQNRLIENRK